MLLFVVLLLGFAPLARTACSYSDADLVNWDSAAAWADGNVPKNFEKAVIASGKKVRLNMSPNLTGLAIESGASLVWGDIDGLVLTTDHIHIKGDFIIGDEDCRFTKKANIKLTGKSDTNNTVSKFGMKFIGVDEGGALEIHGAEKLTWTNLIQTVPPALKTCGVVFNFKDTIYNDEVAKGLFVFAFNLDGSLFDFRIFKTQSADAMHSTAETDFADFLQGIPNNKMLMVAVNGDLGTGTVTRDWNKIYTVVEQVGGITSTALRNVQGREAYAMITKTGSTSTTQEQYAAQSTDPSISYALTDRLSVLDATNDLEFSISGKVAASSSDNRGIDVQVFTKDVARPKIKLNANVESWEVGDKIVVASTDYDWRQAEVFKVFDCSDCAENEVRLDRPVKYLHFGDITYGVDERAEVGVLTRNIRIEGVLEDECYINDEKDEELCGYFNRDTHGGHIKVIRNFRAAHVQGAEIYQMGQQKFVGSYALHFHMCDDVLGNWFRSNSIHKCLTRCTTIHGTDNSEVTGNMCFETLGHSFFLEDSAEQWNIFEGNLAIGTQHGTHLLSDRKPGWCDEDIKAHCDALSSFWITHPNNIFRNNVAAGSDNTGYWFINSKTPLGPSAKRQQERGLVWEDHAYYSKVLEFSGNVAHSNKQHGLRMDERISNGEMSGTLFVPENGIFGATTSHVAKDPPMKNGTRVVSKLSGFRAYKNKIRNVWTKAGNVEMDQFKLADGPVALTMARTTFQTYTKIKNSLIVGETDNKGLEDTPFGRSKPNNRDDEPVRGVVFYQGPGLVENCFFNNFKHKFTDTAFRAGSAIGFKKSNPYPSQANSGVRQIKFGFCDKTEGNWVFDGNASVSDLFANRDGNRQISIHDYDGSVTGSAGSQIVRNEPIFTTPRCSGRSTWNMQVCPYEYCRVVFKGSDGVFETKSQDYPLYLTRDDRPDDSFSLKGERGNNYLALKNYSYILTFNGTVPTQVKVGGENLEPGDFIRVGLCFPKDVESFTFSGSLPLINTKNPAIEVTTIAALDADTTGKAYFWDKARGLLFVKVIGSKERVNHEKCPGHDCPTIIINRVGGSNDFVNCYDDAYGSGVYTKSEDTTTPIPQEATCQVSTADGYGGPAMVLKYPTAQYQPTCAVTPTYPVANHLGCFLDNSEYRDLPHEYLELFRSMTPSFCTQRCYNRGYAYAGLQDGDRCYCGNYYGAFGETPDECNKVCSGDDTKTCGDMNRNSVYSTGIDPPAAQSTCGPNQGGAVVDGKCYYLVDEEGTYTDGQRACVKLGGNLATINSEDIQSGVEIYMRPKQTDAWFGLHDMFESGTHQWVDGTSYEADGYDNTKSMAGEIDNRVAYMIQASSRYAWNDRTLSESHRALCQIPDDATPPAATSCGTDNVGKRFGNGGCYAVINEQNKWSYAVYACYTRMGTPVTVTDSNKADILQHVYRFGDSFNYWTGETAPEADAYYELSFKYLYRKESEKKSTKNGIICEIETLSASKPCATGWEQFNDKCYLYTGVSASNFDIAYDSCEQGSSRMVTIASETENEKVCEIVDAIASKNIFLGLKYEESSSKFLWLDNSEVVYTSWLNGHGLSNIVTGKCVIMKSNKRNWRNRDCAKSGHVFCETDART